MRTYLSAPAAVILFPEGWNARVNTTSAESLVSAAEFLAANNEQPKARELVAAILARRPTMPAHQKRRDRVWLRKAAKLARKLRKSAEAQIQTSSGAVL